VKITVLEEIGKIMGLKVVAIAGSDDKVEWLRKEIGVDVAINYKAPDFRKQVIARARGRRDDVYRAASSSRSTATATRARRSSVCELCRTGKYSAFSRFDHCQPACRW